MAPHPWRRRLLVPAALLSALAACAGDASDVALGPIRSVALTAADPRITAEGAVVADSLLAMAARITPPPGAVCPGSLRLAWSGASLYGVWWAPRADSGARLLVARSRDQGHRWEPASAVDTTDRAVTGCRREAASIAADEGTGYVHVAYALLAPEGPGLFFSHSMDQGATFHAPVPIFYGDHLGRTSVAADGDLVVVAFEDPNSRRPRVGLALSRTMGHIFEQRLLPVSDDNGAASHPLAAVRGRYIAVAWEERAGDSGAAALAIRTGQLPSP